MLTYEPHVIEQVYLGTVAPLVDVRGWFARDFDAVALQAAGGPSISWVELNQSRSPRSTIRGMHFRRDLRQWKQIRVARGAIFDVVVDLRPFSSTYLSTLCMELSDENMRQLILPPGCAHGFQALSPEADVIFNFSVAADLAIESGFRYDDPALAIRWPISPPIIGDRDTGQPAFSEVMADFERDFG
jgi:dTDP-4-dehydrorhamnose 3,5-epimerase